MLYNSCRGQICCGEVIGILMLETYTPFIPGEAENASTYDCSVRYEMANGPTVRKILNKDNSIFFGIN